MRIISRDIGIENFFDLLTLPLQLHPDKGKEKTTNQSLRSGSLAATWKEEHEFIDSLLFCDGINHKMFSNMKQIEMTRI